MKLIIFSGAGLSAESGISTFRDKDGIWSKYDLRRVCNEGTWMDYTDEVHEFYNNRKSMGEKQPNLAHYAIKELQDLFGADCHIITQNVDDLLERAGCTNVLHVHGDITKMECRECDHVWDVGYTQWNYGVDTCPNCGELFMIKPYVVFFGGIAPNYVEMYKKFDSVIDDPDNVALVIGTDGSVVPIDAILKGTSCKKILVNLNESEHIKDDLFDLVYHQLATEAMPRVLGVIKQMKRVSEVIE